MESWMQEEAQLEDSERTYRNSAIERVVSCRTAPDF